MPPVGKQSTRAARSPLYTRDFDPFSIRFDPKRLKRYKAAAKKAQVSANEWIRQACEEKLTGKRGRA